LLAHGDELGLILPKFARPLYFFSHQAFWHFNTKILLEEKSQLFSPQNITGLDKT